MNKSNKLKLLLNPKYDKLYMCVELKEIFMIDGLIEQTRI